jgi:RND family efflux transporter MFP subunit
MMRRIIIGGVIILIGAGAAYGWWHHAHAAVVAVPPPTAEVKHGDVIQAVASSGKVVSNRDVDIGCKASGPVVNLPVDISQEVKAGDLLVQLDTVDEERAVKSADVNVQASQAKLEQTKQNLAIAIQNLTTARAKAQSTLASTKIREANIRAKAERLKTLFDQKLASREDYESAQTDAASAAADLQAAQISLDDLKVQELTIEVEKQDVKLSEAQLGTDQLALEDAKQRLQDTTVISPMDGTVSALNVQVGKMVSSAISVVGGTAVLTLSDLSHIFILATVDESLIGKVEKDQRVEATVDAYPDKVFTGKVVRIAIKGVNTSNVVTFEVKIEMTSADKQLLRPEMTASVRIVTAEVKNVQMVPSTAVWRHSHDAPTVVTVVDASGSTSDREVKMGLNDGTNWEVLSGLKDGEKVETQPVGGQGLWQGTSSIGDNRSSGNGK